MNRIRIHVLPSSRGRVAQPVRPQEPQACSFTQRPCSQPRLDGLEFCIKHVLEDKNAPYRQCSYVSNKNGKRCPNAAPKPEKKDGVTFCAEHARRNALSLQAQMRKVSSGPSPEVLLSQLSGYSRPESGAHSQDGSRSEGSRILDDDRWSEEEQDSILMDQTWRGDPDSEADSIDSDHEDPLKHAGVYTAEEVALITPLRRYRRRYGVEALLHRQLRERRLAATEGSIPQSLAGRSSQRCISFVEGTRCINQSLPMTRHCVSRILHPASQMRSCLLNLPFLNVTLADIYQDSNQVLFKMCPGLKDVPCDRPVHMGQSEEPRCPLHLSLPPPMYQPEQEPLVPEQLTPAPTELYLSAAELQPTENLPLEFSDDLDVVGDGMQCPPSPLLFDTALALEDQSIREIAEAPMDILTEAEQGDLEAAGQDPAELELSERGASPIQDQGVSEPTAASEDGEPTDDASVNTFSKAAMADST
ncbi:hypothetical protein JZ751_005495 [Albula glossodonta]|uniref:KAT8 regulatory NSL complex subunit 2 n=1 Tax=Albula glossodonta TaxID=121402 RepID=A0A8T2N498_9TELE|nr:hypothetical protein JZ751_005495 [Albula glossodonta]